MVIPSTMESIHRLIPKVSVLLPARNEEFQIEQVIISLKNQQYTDFDVWLGDDQSTDQTLARMQALCQGDNRFHIVSIPAPSALNPLKGKTNALQYLGDLAKGELLLLTDADMDLSPTWIQTYVDAFEKNPRLGVAVGTTLVRNSHWQSMEWLWVLQGLALASTFQLPTTGMGNNMAVHQKAWRAVQGFTQIPFSIVEDYALYHRIIQAGFEFKHLFSDQVLGWTFPPDNLLQQRARWIRGAWKTASPWLILTCFTLVLLPLLVCIGLVYPVWGLYLGLAYQVFGTAWGWMGANRIGWKPPGLVLIFSPWVLPIRLTHQALHAFFQKQVVWKNRTYDV